MQRIVAVLARATGAAVLVGLVPAAVAAHDVREVAGGQYEMVVGFLDEPAFAGEKNGLDLSVSRPAPATPGAGQSAGEAEGIPVEGLADTLRAEVIYGEESMELELEPRFGEPGAYRAIFFPTAEGDYTFHIFGDIEGNAVDESFTSSPEGFDSVKPREPLEFPKSGSASVVGAAAGTVSGSGGGTSSGVLAGLAAFLGTGGLFLVQRLRTAPRRVRQPVAPAVVA